MEYPNWQEINRVVMTSSWRNLKYGLRNWWRGYLGLDHRGAQSSSVTVKKIIDMFTDEVRRRRDAGALEPWPQVKITPLPAPEPPSFMARLRKLNPYRLNPLR